MLRWFSVRFTCYYLINLVDYYLMLYRTQSYVICAKSWFSKMGTVLVHSQGIRQHTAVRISLSPKINIKHHFSESFLSCYNTHLQISDYSKQTLIRLKTYSCIKINPGAVTKRRCRFSQLILSQVTSVCELLSLVDALWIVPTNEAVTMSKPRIVRSNK